MEASAKILLSQKGYGQLDQAAGMPSAKPLSPVSAMCLSPKTAAQSYGHTHSSSLAQQFSRLKSEENLPYLDDFKGFEGV